MANVFSVCKSCQYFAFGVCKYCQYFVFVLNLPWLAPCFVSVTFVVLVSCF
jgi:hypothetical protein